MPRLFTGLEVPSSIRQLLSLKQSGLLDIRWVDPADFHITLRFIGDIEPRQANDIVEELSRRVWPAPQISVGELKCFGGSKPTALYAEVKPNEELSNIATTQERLMQQLGLPADSRRFTPHITLGRCRKVSANSVARYLSDQGPVPANLAYTPSRLVLYSARESRGGGPYQIEHSWPFT